LTSIQACYKNTALCFQLYTWQHYALILDPSKLVMVVAKGVGRKFSRGEGGSQGKKKHYKLAKKYRKNSTI